MHVHRVAFIGTDLAAPAVGAAPELYWGNEVCGALVQAMLRAIQAHGSSGPITLAGVDAEVVASGPCHAWLFVGKATMVEDVFDLHARLLDAAPDAMLVVDEEGRIVLVNERTEQLFGYPRSLLLGASLEMLVPERYRGRHAEHRAGFHAAPHTRMMGSGGELYGLHADGHEFAVEIGLAPLRTPQGMLVSAAIRDVSERKRAEAALQALNRELEGRVVEGNEALLRSEARLVEALDGMMEGVQMLDHAWRYTYVNDAVVAQSGYTREQLIGASMLDLYPGVEHTPLFAALEQCKAEGTARGFENTFTFPDGRRGIFELSVRATPDRLFILSSDVSARKRVEQHAERQREKLKQRNAELEQFSYIASHDLQEPLRMVTSYVELLERRYGDRLDADAKEFIAYAVDGTQRMKRLITDLLAYSRAGGEPELVPVPLENVLEEVRRDLQAAVEASGARISADPLPVVQAFRSGMLQLFQNLLSNAIKFRKTDTPPEVHIGVQATADHWAISMADNGVGLDMRFAAQVFQPFKRMHAPDRYPGSGIGLAIARKVVEVLDGRISLTSEPGKGTTVTFVIPRNSSTE